MGSDYGVLAQNSMVRISLCKIDNQIIAIDSTYGSKITSQNNSGSNNNIALEAEHDGRITKAGTQPSGITQEVIENGGSIY